MSRPTTASVDELVIGDPPEAWAALGFHVEDGTCRIGAVLLRFDPEAGDGIAGWTLRGVETAELDGLPAHTLQIGDSPRFTRETGTVPHSNGALAIDHVVVLTPDLARTTAALERAGIGLRRVREAGQTRQAFFRLGEVILEVVGGPQVEDGPARFWGLVVVVEDIERCSELLGERLGEVREAVQPGRRIATVRKSAGIGVPLALMTPEPPR